MERSEFFFFDYISYKKEKKNTKVKLYKEMRIKKKKKKLSEKLCLNNQLM